MRCFCCRKEGHVRNDCLIWKKVIEEKKKFQIKCRNLGFGLATKAKGLQGCGPRESPGVTSHTPRSVGKCEGMNPHTPKATPTLGDGVPMESRKSLETYMSKMGSHCSFGHLKHKLWPKEGQGVKLPV